MILSTSTITTLTYLNNDADVLSITYFGPVMKDWNILIRWLKFSTSSVQLCVNQEATLNKIIRSTDLDLFVFPTTARSRFCC